MHLGLIGFGNIARTLAGLLEDDPVSQITVLVRDRHAQNTRRELAAVGAAKRFDVVTTSEALSEARPDVVAECAGQGAVAEFAPRLLRGGIPTIVASVGALADDALAEQLRGAAQDGGSKLILPAGAIGGIDILSALAPAGHLRVDYRGTKPPAAWKGTPAENTVGLDSLDAPSVFFSGNAREAARTYPKNANVAATLALAGAGFEETKVQLIADPDAPGNSHAFEVRSPLCSFSVEIANAASDGNSKTSVTTVYSVLREINRVRKAVLI
jgi:aspartate dehydrogenase